MRRTLALVLLLCIAVLAGIALAEVVFQDVEYDPGTPEQTPGQAENGLSSPEVPAVEGVEILVTAAGDVTFGGNMRGNPKSNIYTKMLAQKEGNLAYFFANVYDIFAQDDLTIVNFEGTLTEETRHKNNDFVFRAPPSHVQALTLGAIEAVALENNHIMDFGETGYRDTVQALTSQGIVYASDGRMGVYETKGVSIAMLAYQTFNGAYDRLFTQVPQDIAAARAQHDLVIVSFHWGDELDYKPKENQIKLGRASVDAGADLVLGHHSHRVNPIEEYNGKYIVYSLGNCSFSGNSQPRDMDTFLFQQKFLVSDGTVSSGGFRIIPASISSVTGQNGGESGVNDFAVTPFSEGSQGISRVINKLMQNGKQLEYAVKEYPTSWQ